MVEFRSFVLVVPSVELCYSPVLTSPTISDFPVFVPSVGAADQVQMYNNIVTGHHAFAYRSKIKTMYDLYLFHTF